MKSMSLIKDINTEKPFAVLIRDQKNVTAVGITPRGKDWANWLNSSQMSEPELEAAISTQLLIDKQQPLTEKAILEVSEALPKEVVEQLTAIAEPSAKSEDTYVVHETKQRPKATREDAMRVARYLGCRGAHQRPDGNWVPCADEETLMRISNAAEAKAARKKRKKRDEWENLEEGGIVGIDTLPGGGLVSEPIGKAAIAARMVRSADPDVFDNRDSARIRARMLGCIGIRQYRLSGGGVSWMPCTNESDYRRALGSSPQGRRDVAKREMTRFREMSQMAKKELTDRQRDIYDDLEETVAEYGPFDKGVGADGSHYVEAEKNPFIDQGLVCSNCAFWVGPNGCEIVEGEIEPNAICKLWVIDEDKLPQEEKGEKFYAAQILVRSGKVLETQVEVKARRKARSDRLAATPAPAEDRVFGSSKNPKGSASSVSDKIVLDARTTRALEEKVRTHNDKMRKEDNPEWSMASLSQLKVVYRRGAGAFSTSHRPNMTRGQWAMGRVNAFLYMLENGRPENSRYVNDFDLLHDRHPWKKSGQQI